ncbi:MAG: transporter substrate-binding domain-containing protein [Tissierellia bacterium]|nr:transporter substrate-binding domain-containing protein [Tissierellia bacterium]
MKKKLLAMVAVVLTLSMSLTACGQTTTDEKTQTEAGVKEGKIDPNYRDEYKVEKVDLKAEDFSESSTMYKILKEGKINIGTNAAFPPYEFIAKINGETKIVGIDADLAYLLGKKLGIEVEIQDVDFDALITGLSLGTHDLLLAGMNKDPEREKSISFSDDYYQANMVVLMRAEDLDKYDSLDDFGEDFTFGNQLGTIHEKLTKEKFPKAQNKTIPSYSDLIVDLKAGNIDGMLLEDVVAKSYASEDPKLVVNESVSFTSEEGMAMGLTKDDTEFQKFLNDFIKELQDNGTMEKIVLNNLKLAENEEEKAE